MLQPRCCTCPRLDPFKSGSFHVHSVVPGVIVERCPAHFAGGTPWKERTAQKACTYCGLRYSSWSPASSWCHEWSQMNWVELPNWSLQGRILGREIFVLRKFWVVWNTAIGNWNASDYCQQNETPVLGTSLDLSLSFFLFWLHTADGILNNKCLTVVLSWGDEHVDIH